MIEYKNETSFKYSSKSYFLEFNCRFGDPETQSILPLLDSSSDLYDIMCGCMLGNELQEDISWRKNMKSINVVMSHIDYPYSKLDNPVQINFSNGLKRFLMWDKKYNSVKCIKCVLCK